MENRKVVGAIELHCKLKTFEEFKTISHTILDENSYGSEVCSFKRTEKRVFLYKESVLTYETWWDLSEDSDDSDKLERKFKHRAQRQSAYANACEFCKFLLEVNTETFPKYFVPEHTEELEPGSICNLEAEATGKVEPEN